MKCDVYFMLDIWAALGPILQALLLVCTVETPESHVSNPHHGLFSHQQGPRHHHLQQHPAHC